MSRMDGEEMEDRMSQTRKTRLAGKGFEHHEPGVGGGTERAWEQISRDVFSSIYFATWPSSIHLDCVNHNGQSE